jgi:exopolysaccharide biosynthesis predicted pyruvyltransferase EpsI
MSPLFDTYRDVTPKYPMVIYHHNVCPFTHNDVPVKNNCDTMDDTIRFLASGDTVVTNTYHGMYWATLLGRKVVVVKPFSTRFLFHKYRHVHTILKTLDLMSKVSLRYPEALQECREANMRFAEKVKNRISESCQ